MTYHPARHFVRLLLSPRAPWRPGRASRLRLPLAACLLVCFSISLAEKRPPLWGYGTKSCQAFIAAADGRDQGQEMQTWEYRRYQDWLTGFVTGLNLSTGQDVLLGVEIEAAMDRVRAHCRGHLEEDFFNSTMDLVRMLSGLR